MSAYEIEHTMKYDPVTGVFTITEEFWESLSKEEVYTPKEEKYQDYYGLQIKVD